MRQTIHQLLTSQIGLIAVVPASRWFSPGAVIDMPPKPYVILRWLAPVGGDARGTFAHQLQVIVHDKRGSYDQIEELLGGPHRTGGVYPVLKNITDYVGPDGRISQADYLGDSGDDVDVDQKSNTKYSSWQIAGRTTS